MAALLAEAVKKFVRDSVPEGSGTSPEEVESVVSLCLLGVHRTGQEDPRAMARAVSDPVLEHLVRRSRKARGIPALAKAFQFLIMEWCFRNGYLHEDWLWEWDGANEGQIKFSARMPLAMIPIPSE